MPHIKGIKMTGVETVFGKKTFIEGESAEFGVTDALPKKGCSQPIPPIRAVFNSS